MQDARTLTLRQGKFYSINDQCFEQGKPQPINEDEHFFRLINTGQFEETPPLCFYHIRPVNSIQSRITQLPDGRWLRISGESLTRVSRYVWNQINHTGQFEIIPPLEVMKQLVQDGKPDFRLLIIRNSNLGDVIMCSDVLYHIHQMFPQAYIAFAADRRFVRALENLDFINEIGIIGYIDPTDFDVSVSLCGAVEKMPDSAMHERLDLYGRPFAAKFPWVKHELHLQLSDEENQWFNDFNSYHNPDGLPVVMLQPYGSGPHRSINPDIINDITEWLVDNGYFVYICGTSYKRFPELNPSCFKTGHDISILWDCLDIRQLFAVIKNSQFIIGPDSSGYHIATAFDTPAITVFTTVSDLVRTRYYSRVYPLSANCKCAPCWDHPCRIALDAPCVQGVSARMIIGKCKDAIASGFPYLPDRSYIMPEPRY